MTRSAASLLTGPSSSSSSSQFFFHTSIIIEVWNLSSVFWGEQRPTGPRFYTLSSSSCN